MMDWLNELINNNSVTDICINGTESVFVDFGGGLQATQDIAHTHCSSKDLNYSDTELRDWVLNELSQIGKTWDAKHPFTDGTLRSGHRIHVVFPPIARTGLVVSLRRLASKNLESWISGKIRWESSSLYSFIVKAIQRGDSMIISGATGSGKTTLASDLLSEVPVHERMIALEDTPELNPRHPHFLSLVSRPHNSDGFGEVSLRTLLKQSLRMRPDRIVLGECRGSEMLELLQAINTGHRGALATLHANSAHDALRRIELLCLLSSHGSLSVSVIRELIVLGVQWIIQVRRTGTQRKIEECWKIEGREGDTILLRQVVD